MKGKNIYVAQFGTGANINLLPLAAGQLISKLKQDEEILKNYNIKEIIFRRDNPEIIAKNIESPAILGYSCFLWNRNHSIEVAKKVKEKFKDSLCVLGGPSIPNGPGLGERFLSTHPFVDVICIGEGEEVFASLCKNYLYGKSFSEIQGIIYRDREKREIIRTGIEKMVDMNNLPSPYLDGTFDELYGKYSSEFSGIILETNRGCPYKCSYCTWGNQVHKMIREKPLKNVIKEVEWVGKNKINYIAMSDANFGIRDGDLKFTKLLAETKKRYGAPNFISVSWAKNSSKRILDISRILKDAEIGFRITLSLQSLNNEVVKAINRTNIKKQEFDKIKDAYKNERAYSYTELILGLPLETKESYLSGIEKSLSTSIFEQLYVYPLFLFPNTELSSEESKKKYNIQSRKIESLYTKSKVSNEIREDVDIVVGTSAMPKEKWVDSFTEGYYSLALHDDRLAFFILNYLKRELGAKITEITSFARKNANHFPVIKSSFSRLENCALDVQNKNKSHLITPRGYDDMPFDPPEGIFLELLNDKKEFYSEFSKIITDFLNTKKIKFDKAKLKDLFKFQDAVIATPYKTKNFYVDLNYNWPDYFSFSFNLPEKKLEPKKSRLKIVDLFPCNGDLQLFLKKRFDIRGVPAFNSLLNKEGKIIFPPLKL